MRTVLILAAASCCLLKVCLAQAPVDTSICSIANRPTRFHNKNVRVRGTALSGMEASVLIDSKKDGSRNEACGRINLHFDSSGSDESTKRFLQLFGEQVKQPQCDQEEQIKQGLAHLLDPNVPAPTPCFNSFCIHCPRYSIVATFVGRLRYSGKEPGHARFGHLGMFDLQLDVANVSDLDVTDMLASPKQ